LSSVANRYSKALFELALEQGKLEEVESDLILVRELITSSKEFANLLLNPLIPFRVRSESMSKLFKGKVDQLTLNFFQLICQKKRTNLLVLIIERFIVRILDYRNIVRIEVVSAHPLADVQLSTINAKVAEIVNKKIELEQKIDQNLIGGFIIKIRDTVIDLSVKGQIEKLRTKLITG
jgi:F-type H+-transporting ATPase subunit delta